MALVQQVTLEQGLLAPTPVNCDHYLRIKEHHHHRFALKHSPHSPTLKIGKFHHQQKQQHGYNSFERSHINDDVVLWTSLISRYCRMRKFSEAMRAFMAMISADVNPNHITMVVLLSSCEGPFLASSIHGYACKIGAHLEGNVAFATALVNMYSKTNRTEAARQVFDRMPERNSMSWNSMINGYMRNSEIKSALSLFDQMPKRDKVSWTILICGFEKHGQYERAMKYFREMQLSGTEADWVTIISVLSACANVGGLGQGLWLHRYSLGRQFNCGIRWSNSLIDMYSRCGRIDYARQVFDQMPKRTIVSWNSMIVGFAINGLSEDALRHFAMMESEGIKPDHVSFTGVLTACSHAGLVGEGLVYFDMMRSHAYKVSPRVEHYGCVVDLLSRAGHLGEALQLIENMPMKPNSVVLGSLLGACRVHGDLDLAERLMGFLIELEPDCDSNYVLLSNMYASVGRWEGVGKVRKAMKALGMKKRPGFSAIELDCCTHEFVAGDRSHDRAGEIYAILDHLSLELKLYGYVPQTDVLTLPEE